MAAKARKVVKHILEEIEAPNTEIFPKQDKLDENTKYGNFINAPLFGKLVPNGKTVFVNPDTFVPYEDQWDFLENIKCVSESLLDDIIEINGLNDSQSFHSKTENKHTAKTSLFVLPPCIRTILLEGVKTWV